MSTTAPGKTCLTAKVWLLFFLLAMSAISGCAPTMSPLDKAYSLAYSGPGGQQDYLNLLEAEGAALEALDDHKLYVACSSFFGVRDYSGFVDCADAFLPRATREGWKPVTWLSTDHQGPWETSWAEVRGRILTWRALMEMDLGDLEAARRDAEEAVRVLEDDWENPARSYRFTVRAVWKFHYAHACRAYGLVMARLGEVEKAEEAIAKIEDLSDFANGSKLNKIKHPSVAQIRLASKDYEGAKEAIGRYSGITTGEVVLFGAMAAVSAGAGAIGGVQAVAEAVNMGVGALGVVAGSLEENIFNSFFLAKVAFETGDMEAARAGYDALLSKEGLPEITGLHYVILHDRGRIAEMDGEAGRAIEFFGQAVLVIEAQRSTIHVEASKIGFAGDKQAVYHDMVRLLVEQGRFEEAFGYAERSKARALVDMLAAKDSFSGLKKAPEDTQAPLLAELGAVEQEQLPSLSGTRAADSRALKLRRKIREETPETASLISVDPPDTESIRSLLPADETLVEFYGEGDDLYAFIVTARDIKAVKLDGVGLAESVAELRRWIKNPEASSRGLKMRATTAEPGAEAGHALYRRLFEPLAELIPTENVTIVPHGSLHYLPFAALSTGEGYLLDRYKIRMLPSASVMQFLKEGDEKAGAALVFGNPDLGRPELDLPFAQAEAQSIGKMVAGSRVLIRNQATETAAKNSGSGFRYLHFASHGIFDAERPMDSGLLLAGDGENDGRLTVSELYECRLDADLVTLSACETALGKVASGDDVVGFTRGFLYAGANSIVSSLWQVDDKATGELMQAFYRNLKKKGKREALRLAQLDLRNGGFEHPYYWSAFQLTGAAQ